MPALHPMHTVLRVAAYRPPAQALHRAMPVEGWYLPTGHTTQPTAAAAEGWYMPVLHATQAAATEAPVEVW